MPFNIPAGYINRDTYTGCPPGYVLINGACVNVLQGHILEVDETAEYDFYYYEHCGELVGKYDWRIVNNPASPPTYFAQNCNLAFPSLLGITKPAQALAQNEPAICMNLIHDHNNSNPTLVIEQTVLSTDPLYNNTFLMGEFHLLNNTPAAIKRINLNYDLINDTGVIYSDWSNKKMGAPLKIPSAKEGDSNSFIKWYMGYVRLPSSDRPDEMMFDSLTQLPVTPTLKDPVYATDRLQWKTIKDSCYKWLQVYDGYSLLDLYANNIPMTGHYLIQFKCVVDVDKLKAFMNLAVDTATYQDEEYYKLIFYPPSFYAFPIDAISTITKPNMNTINSFVNEIIFKVPDNYKTDGNIHYIIEFLTEKNSEDILFRSTSLTTYEWSEDFAWSESKDQVEWKSFAAGLPTFNNEFRDNFGSDSENIKYIKYELTDAAREILRERSDILFKIKQIDGTLQ